jgi:hypothetical protein
VFAQASGVSGIETLRINLRRSAKESEGFRGVVRFQHISIAPGLETVFIEDVEYGWWLIR